MSGRLKLPPKAKKVKASSKKSLDTADDFQQAADAEEETGGKWRAGDKAKAARAFFRAIDLYDQGLSRFPRNFDLAYNKARLQFEVSEQPSLVPHFPLGLDAFLQSTLQSHRYALQLKQDNTDILFNTSQLLISLAESTENEATDSQTLLREALELLDACFNRQSTTFQEQQTAWEGLSAASGGAAASPPAPPSTSSSLESATVESSVQPSDLLDTLHASLTALSSLLPLADPSDLPSLEKLGSSLLSKQAEVLALLSPEDGPDMSLASKQAEASFHSSLAAAAFTSNSLSADVYLSKLEEAFAPLDLSESEAACLAADALVEALAAIYSRERNAQPLLPLLHRAKDLYASATAALDAAAAPKVEKGALTLGGGDKEALALAAGAREAHGDAAVLLHRFTGRGLEEAVTLYSAAEKGYRAAEDTRAATAVAAREVVARTLAGEAKGPIDTKVAKEMLDEGLLDDTWAQ